MTVLAGAAAYPLLAGAQQKVMPALGFLGSGSPGPEAPFVAAFREGLGEAGYVEGQNVAIEYRWAEGSYDRLPALAADLVGRQVDVIAADAIPAARAAKNATTTTPIVFEVGIDPVEFGLVAGFARPGGNLTGVGFLTVELMPKRLELLSELVPQAGAFVLLVNPTNENAEHVVRDGQDAARAKGVQLTILKAASENEIDTAFATLAQLRAGALIVSPDPFFTSRREQLVVLATRDALPAIYPLREAVAARSDQLRNQPHFGPSLARHLRRKDPEGRQADRTAGPATDDLRTGRQSQDRQGSRSHRPALDPRPCRRGHRMNDRFADLERVVLASQRPEGAWAGIAVGAPRGSA
jgi:putative ABC transport system substrate-binding protein